jgi:S1-C subfamily serine protease
MKTPPRGGRAINGAGPGGDGPGDPRAGLRYRILPRSLLGIAALILAFALGAGFSGVVLYSYYQYHLDQTNGRVNALIDGYKKQFANAEGDLQASANKAKGQIQSQLAPLQQLQADPKTLALLVKNLSPSLFFVHTQDANGQPVVGTAFVISSNAQESLLLTSATTVAASQQNPAPAVYVRQNNTDVKVTVRTVDSQYDLALIVLPTAHLPVIKVAPATPAPAVGDKIFAMSGLGTAGAGVSQGALTDVSAAGVSENAPIGQAFQGGPLVNAAGQVVAVASRTYAPQGFPSDAVWFAPYPQAACAKVISCPAGSISASQ